MDMNLVNYQNVVRKSGIHNYYYCKHKMQNYIWNALKPQHESGLLSLKINFNNNDQSIYFEQFPQKKLHLRQNYLYYMVCGFMSCNCMSTNKPNGIVVKFELHQV